MFFARFEERCKQKNVKPTPLITAIGLSKGNLSKWRNGTVPTGDILAKIADSLDCSVDYLLGRTDYPEINNGQFEYDGVKLEGTIIPVKGGYIHLDNGAALPPEAIAELEKRLQTKK